MTADTEAAEVPVNSFMPISAMMLPVQHYSALLAMAAFVRDVLGDANSDEPVGVIDLAIHHGVLLEQDGDAVHVDPVAAEIWNYLAAQQAAVAAETEDEVREAVPA